MAEARSLTPSEIVSELDRYIVGQNAAKRAVAIALRNRWRRFRVGPELRDEVIPKNIILVGPTGVGKTEIARRLARLAQAPFVKVEASKFTEVGYVGRDVDSMIRDLMVEVDVQERPQGNMQIFGAQGMEEMGINLQEMLGNLPFGKKSKKHKLRVPEARRLLEQQEAEKLVDNDTVVREALERVQSSGIVFIDEIDKVAGPGGISGQHGPDVSRGGVQRDLLPLVEGSTVNTKYGPVKTDHVLFIAAGAFHVAKVSDLLPELQGRFPIRVELEALSQADLVRILAEPRNALTRQYTALLGAEGVELVFDPSGIEELARVAQDMNTRTQNIGARRLHTVLEKVLEDVSFGAPDF